MVRTNIYLTKNQHLYISNISKNEGIKFSEMVRKMIDHYIEGKNNEKMRGMRKRKA